MRAQVDERNLRWSFSHLDIIGNPRNQKPIENVARYVIMQGDAFLTQFVNLYALWVEVLHKVVLIRMTNLIVSSILYLV
jgi:hypothetical protein